MEFKKWFEQHAADYASIYEEDARSIALDLYNRRVKDLTDFEYEEVVLNILDSAYDAFEEEGGKIDRAKALDIACGLIDWGFMTGCLDSKTKRGPRIKKFVAKEPEKAPPKKGEGSKYWFVYFDPPVSRDDFSAARSKAVDKFDYQLYPSNYNKLTEMAILQMGYTEGDDDEDIDLLITESELKSEMVRIGLKCSRVKAVSESEAARYIG